MFQPSPLCALRELIAALDRRVPQPHRAGEPAIAAAAADLRHRAVSELAACAGADRGQS